MMATARYSIIEPLPMFGGPTMELDIRDQQEPPAGCPELASAVASMAGRLYLRGVCRRSRRSKQ